MSTIIVKEQNNKIRVIYPSDYSKIDEIIKGLKNTNTQFVQAFVNFVEPFFDAYEFNNKIGAECNINKAKEIWLDYYRRARTSILEKLDLEYMRADEQGNLELKKEIAAKKQALRDVTKTDLPNTLEGIKSTWPDILGPNPFNK